MERYGKVTGLLRNCYRGNISPCKLRLRIWEVGFQRSFQIRSLSKGITSIADAANTEISTGKIFFPYRLLASIAQKTGPSKRRPGSLNEYFIKIYPRKLLFPLYRHR